MAKLKKYLPWALLASLIIIQFFRIDKSKPEYDTFQDFINITNPSESVKSSLKNACYDCHSNESKYPWYTNIAPVSFWVKGHIKGARQHLNFSEWGTYSAKKADHKLEECIEELQERNMPLKSYTWLHGEAKLSDEKIEELKSFFGSKRISED